MARFPFASDQAFRYNLSVLGGSRRWSSNTVRSHNAGYAKFGDPRSRLLCHRGRASTVACPDHRGCLLHHQETDHPAKRVRFLPSEPYTRCEAAETGKLRVSLRTSGGAYAPLSADCFPATLRQLGITWTGSSQFGLDLFRLLQDSSSLPNLASCPKIIHTYSRMGLPPFAADPEEKVALSVEASKAYRHIMSRPKIGHREPYLEQSYTRQRNYTHQRTMSIVCHHRFPIFLHSNQIIGSLYCNCWHLAK